MHKNSWADFSLRTIKLDLKIRLDYSITTDNVYGFRFMFQPTLQREN